MTTPATVVPWPPIHFVALCTEHRSAYLTSSSNALLTNDIRAVVYRPNQKTFRTGSASLPASKNQPTANAASVVNDQGNLRLVSDLNDLL